jgi:PAN domain
MGTKAKVSGLCTLLLIAPAFAGDAQMVIVAGKDVKGEVFKRLGLPNQMYCWEQCLAEARCTGTRWAEISGTTAGQCQLMRGDLSFIEPHEIKTEDGQRIRVTASRRQARQ